MNGPILKREWRDVPWIILFFLGLIAFVIIFALEKTTVDDYFKPFGGVPSVIFDEVGKNIGSWFVAMGIPLALGLIFLLVTPTMAGCVIWTIIILKITLFIVVGIVCFIAIGKAGGFVLGIFFLLIGGIYILITCCLKNQIRIGIILVKAAGVYFL